jgi:chemotaxis protein CheD
MSRGNGKNIRMGELAVASEEGVLCTLLGSCIGLALYDQRRRVGGLVHIVLPHSRGKTDLPGKYVDTAIPELLSRLEEAGGNQRTVTARIAGGANMFNTSAQATVGSQNLDAVEKALEKRGVPVLGRHCQGEHGRKMTFHIDSGKVFIEQVGVGQPFEI